MPGSRRAQPRTGVRQLRSIARSLYDLDAIDRSALDAIEALPIDRWLPYARIDGLLQEAVRRTGQPHIGLLAGERVRQGDYDVLEYAVRSARDVGQAIELVNRYIGLVGEAARYALVGQGEVVLWTLGLRHEGCRQFSDYVVAHMMTAARALTGSDFRPTRVLLTHGRPPDLEPYARVLHCPVHFGADENAIAMPADHLRLPIVGGDPGLNAVMQRYAGEQLARLPNAEDFSQQVRAAVTSSLGSGAVDATWVADHLGVSERTLRRRLSEHGTSLRAITLEVRQRLARHYLQQPELSISEVAFLLGFADNTAFHRAFRGWTGVTPRQFRERLT